MKMSNSPPNFGRLVLLCIKADFASKYAFCSIFRGLQNQYSPVWGEKKEQACLFPPKKSFGKLRARRRRRGAEGVDRDPTKGRKFGDLQ